MANGDLVTKAYVDNGKRTKFVLSRKQPTNVPIGTIWYAPITETWADVDAKSMTFGEVNALNITWADVDSGAW